MLTAHEEMQYQIDLLLAELDELQNRTSAQVFWPRNLDDAASPRPGRLDMLMDCALLRVREFYWTLTRWMGMAHLHDGSAPTPERRRKAELDRRPVFGTFVADAGQTPRIFLDLTATFLTDGKSGIQRVARNLAKSIVAVPGCLPVIMDGDVLRPYFRDAVPDDIIRMRAGDTIIFCDLTSPNLMRKAAAAARRQGASIATLVYDLIPLTQPGFSHSAIIRHFGEWFSTAIAVSDQILTVSQVVARQVSDRIRDRPDSDRPRVGWLHLAAELDELTEAANVPQAVTTGAPYFLVVGTLEPRKGHGVALDAFEMLWAAGIDAKLVIAGRYGWNAHNLIRRICDHPELNRRLFWLDRPSDMTLRQLYKGARALLAPSLAEGFGLPLVEAASYGTPIVASDLPVFKEICGDHARYFPTLDPQRLSAEVRRALSGDTVAPRFTVRSWADVAQDIVRHVREAQATKPVAREMTSSPVRDLPKGHTCDDAGVTASAGRTG